MKLTISCVVFSLSILTAAGQGMVCRSDTIRGSWGVTCSGQITPGPDAPLTSAGLLGTCAIAVDGKITCEATFSLGGMMLTQAVQGQAVVNEDCTGTVKYKQTLNGKPAPDLNVRYFIYDGGKKMRGLSIDPGSVLACRLVRIGM